MSSRPIRISALHGHVKMDTYAKGSKSESNAVFIETTDSCFILRRKTGPAFGDVELLKYIGHEVECEGFLIENTLLAEQIEIVE
ncbi:hypothetical protein NMT12_90140 [metagenome]